MHRNCFRHLSIRHPYHVRAFTKGKCFPNFLASARGGFGNNSELDRHSLRCITSILRRYGDCRKKDEEYLPCDDDNFVREKPCRHAKCPICPRPPDLTQPVFKPNFEHKPRLDGETSANMTYQRFTVQATSLAPNELLGLTGDVPALGEWQLEQAIPLRPLGFMQWFTNVLVPASTRGINYRYFTYVLGPQGAKMVRRWEAHQQPRLLNGVLSSKAIHIDRFGESKGEVNLKRGWLSNGSILQLKFTRGVQHFVFGSDGGFDLKQLHIKVVPLQADQRSPVSSKSGLSVDVAKLDANYNPLQPQPEEGVNFEAGTALIFHITVPSPLSYAFELIFLTPDQQPLGSAKFHTRQLLSSVGELELKISKVPSDETKQDESALATLKLPYLLIQPLMDAKSDFSACLASIWPKSWPCLDIAQRGDGYVHDDDIVENTLAACMHAYKAKADMVELDVHLTADGIPVLNCAFSVKTAKADQKVETPKDLEPRLIQDLSYAQLRQLRVFRVDEDCCVNEVPPTKGLFPRLSDVLQALPIDCAVHVDLKSMQPMPGDAPPQTMDKNYVVDRLLQVVLPESANGRLVTLSSFDGDICNLLRYKQTQCPVLLATRGASTKYPAFQDLHTHGFEQALSFASAFEMLGTACNCEVFLKDNGESQLKTLRDMGQCVFVWGNELKKQEVVDKLRCMGVQGLFYNELQRLMPKDKKQNFFKQQADKESKECKI